MDIKVFMAGVGTGVDVAGALIVVIGALYATREFIRQWFQPEQQADAYRNYRQSFGKAILLGLEFLVAGDIIRTVAVFPTLDNVTVLLVVVVIRTFLSTTLQLEVNGRWPWQPPVLPTSLPADRRASTPE